MDGVKDVGKTRHYVVGNSQNIGEASIVQSVTHFGRVVHLPWLSSERSGGESSDVETDPGVSPGIVSM